MGPVLAAAALGLCALIVYTDGAAAPAPSVETDAQILNQTTAINYVYAPDVLSTPNASSSDSSSRMVGQWPALDKMGISQTVFSLGACALRPPHYHLRATGLLYLISGNIQVGFTSEDGKTAYVNNITAGSSALFPQGLVHYQLNLGCDPAMYTISYNSDDPGTQVAVPGLFGLPGDVVAASLGMASSPNQAAALIAAAPTSKFVANSDPTCVQTCAAATSLAPAVSQSASAGR